eukprot:6288729-Amphidinium_carterae.1
MRARPSHHGESPAATPPQLFTRFGNPAACCQGHSAHVAFYRLTGIAIHLKGSGAEATKPCTEAEGPCAPRPQAVQARHGSHTWSPSNVGKQGKLG